MGFAFNDTTKDFNGSAVTSRPELYPGFLVCSRTVRPQMALSIRNLVVANVPPRHWRLTGSGGAGDPFLVERVSDAEAAAIDQAIQDAKTSAAATASAARAELAAGLAELRAADPATLSRIERLFLAAVDLGVIR